MKRKIIAVLIALLTCGTFVWADTIYLKNGSVIKGEIIEVISEPEISYKIRTRDGSIFVFKMKHIEKVVLEKRRKTVDGIIAFVITPSIGRYDPEDLGEADILYKISGRWVTARNVAFQLELGRWSHHFDEKNVRFWSNIFGLTGLYFIEPEGASSLVPYVGAGLGFYSWHAEPDPGYILLISDEDQGVGYHLCCGIEFRVGENLGFGLEIRYIIMGSTTAEDWDMDFTSIIFDFNLPIHISFSR